MKKELEARKTLNKYRNSWYNEIDKEKVEVANALDVLLPFPTEKEVCEALNKLWKLDYKPHTTLHFIYNEFKKEFKMINENNTEYRYISVNRWSDTSIQFVDLDLETLSLLGRFYEGVIANEKKS